MKYDQLPSAKTQISFLVASTIGAAICLSGLALLAYLSATNLAEALTGIALFLAISGAAVIGYQLNSLKRDQAIQREAGEIKRVFMDHSPLGLVSVSTDASSYDYTELLVSSRKLVIVLNDGRTWLSVHRDRLRKRFADARTRTTVFLIHPNSDLLSIQARKGSTDVHGLRAKIHESLALLSAIKQGNPNLEVLGHHLYNTHSVVLGDSDAALTPYFLSRGGRAVPLYHYVDTGGPCYFRDLADDLEQLRIDSEEIDLASHVPVTRGASVGNVVRL